MEKSFKLGGHLGWVHSLKIVNSAAINTVNTGLKKNLYILQNSCNGTGSEQIRQ